MTTGGGETKDSPSGWTVDTLQAHLQQLLVERDRRFEERFVAQEKAVSKATEAADMALNKAEAAAEKWRQNANEWRGAMNDRERNLMPRPECEQQFKSLDEKISSITRICVGVVVLGIAVITVVLLILRK